MKIKGEKKGNKIWVVTGKRKNSIEIYAKGGL